MFKSNSALLVLPTGAGKTLTVAGLCSKAIESKPDMRILFLVNKVSLVEQAAKVFKPLVENVGIFCGSLNLRQQNTFTVASVQSLARADIEKFHLLIADEAHRFDQQGGSQYMRVYNKLKALNPNIGATYVVAQHLSPDNSSLLTELLSRQTRLPVSVVNSGQSLELDHIYITPPNHDIVYDHRRLISPSSYHKLHLYIFYL